MPVYVSDRLTATLGVVRGSPTPTRLIQWFRGSTVIPGANASTYTITSDDLGQPISVRQTESNYFGSAVATSAATEAVEVFSPSILFSASEPGVWFDPTDAANLAWRRNLVLYSNQPETTTGITVTANTVTAPDGSLTGTRLTKTDATTPRYSIQTTKTTILPNTVYTASRYVKYDGYDTLVSMEYNGVGNYGVPWIAPFSVSSTGVIANTPTVCTTAVQNVGSGWYRLTATFTTGTATLTLPVDPYILMQITGASGASVQSWGAQLEVGSTATAYQPITNLNNEVIAQFPNATLYQDATGSIPVYAPEQPVGLMLDKSKGLVLGPELVTNGNFANPVTTGWVPDSATIAVVSGQAELTSTVSGTFQANYQAVTVSGRTYKMTATLRRGTCPQPVYFGFNGVNSISTNNTTDTTVTIYLAANGPSTNVQIYSTGASVGSTLYFDNITVKELPGNHATQSTAISRPLYGIVPVSGRRNLLTYSEQFENVIWDAFSGRTALVTVNAAVAPDGTTTAEKIVEAAAAAGSVLHRVIASDTSASAAKTLSVYAKKAERKRIYLFANGLVSGGPNQGAWFDLDTGAFGAGTDFPGGTPAIQSVGNGWYRCSLTPSSASVGGSIQLLIIGDSATTYDQRIGNGTSGIFVWGAQLETGSTATAYQKVTNDYDVTEAGVASVGYLRFDGTNDFMVTPTITPGTNKVQVFTGVRKLGEATLGMLAELSAGSGNGLFFLSAPRNTNTSSYSFYNQGTTGVDVVTAGSFPTPITNILTALGDISADSTILRANSVQVGQSSTDLGTGNYLANPLYLGRRGGITFEFNGQLFPMIVRFGPNMSSALIRTTENWVASKTAGVVLP